MDLTSGQVHVYDICIVYRKFEIPGIESAKKKSKGMFSSIGATKQGLEMGNSCFAKGMPGTMAQFIVAPRWGPFVNALEA